ncbi:MAG: HAMP domain-containing protein [Bacteriovoracaceae bacterium]|nr:HAMP domain-containing protein [Bacteriovoracaceae bacterium]
MKISHKLTFGFLLITFLILIVGYISFESLDEMTNDVHEVSESNLQEISSAAEMVFELTKMQVYIREYLLEHIESRSSEIIRAKAEIDSSFDNFEKQLKAAEQAINKGIKAAEDEEKQDEVNELKNLKSIKDHYLQYKKGLLKTIFICTQQGYDQAGDYFEEKVEKRGIELLKKIRWFERDSTQEISEEANEILTEATLLKRTVIITTLLTFLIAIIVGLIISRSITVPLKKIKDAATDIAAGNLDRRVQNHNRDELGELSLTFNQMAIGLGALLEKEKSLATVTAKAKSEKKKVLELETINEKLKKTQVQLIQSAKLASLGELSAGLAHELNNPLQSIIGFTQALRDYISSHEQVISKDTEEYFIEITNNYNRMREIIKHFRVFSRQNEQINKSVDVNEVINNSFILFKEQLRLGNIKYQLDLDKGGPKVFGNEIRLEQVFTNLITNGRDAISSVDKAQEGMLLVSSKVNADCVVLDFKDSGMGISEQKIDRIFDPFFTTKDTDRGTGLGLSISYGIIKDHKGQICCHETSNKGTTFRIILPLLTNA